jgi:hypothetical protein
MVWHQRLVCEYHVKVRLPLMKERLYIGSYLWNMSSLQGGGFLPVPQIIAAISFPSLVKLYTQKMLQRRTVNIYREVD